MPALLACARGGWGVALVSGTGCNARGRDREHKRKGIVTGFGTLTGEGAGATELVYKTMQHVSHEWIRRGPATALTPALVKYAGARDLADLVEGYCQGTYTIGPKAAPLIFEVARGGDRVARQAIRWAGVELGELANAIIRQLDIADLEFDVVLAGSMFRGGPLLTDPMWETITQLAPRTSMVHMDAPPVAGSVILGMEQIGLQGTKEIRRNVSQSLQRFQQNKPDLVAD
jgi:N-acetylglucosamine kinase-like BadF-type ATPase